MRELNDEPITDAEAEAVLMALAPRLTWQTYTAYRWVAQAPDCRWSYTVATEPGSQAQFTSRFDIGDGMYLNRTFAPSLAQAQAACERHFVTACWDLTPLSINRFYLHSTALEDGTHHIDMEVRYARTAKKSEPTSYLEVYGDDAAQAQSLLVEKLLTRGWTRRDVDAFFASPKRSEDIHYGPYRTICLLCGQNIEGALFGNSLAVGLRVEREGTAAGYGDVHRRCLGNRQGPLDLTGCPDYSGYETDGAKPAYPEGHDPVARGLAADAACRAERACHPAEPSMGEAL